MPVTFQLRTAASNPNAPRTLPSENGLYLADIPADDKKDVLRLVIADTIYDIVDGFTKLGPTRMFDVYTNIREVKKLSVDVVCQRKS